MKQNQQCIYLAIGTTSFCFPDHAGMPEPIPGFSNIPAVNCRRAAGMAGSPSVFQTPCLQIPCGIPDSVPGGRTEMLFSSG